jgi:hypothetical protein
MYSCGIIHSSINVKTPHRLRRPGYGQPVVEVNIDIILKTCKGCKQQLPISNFGPEKRNRDGRQGRCRVCASAQDRAKRANNRERYRAISNRYAHRNREKELERGRNYRANNQEKIKAYEESRREISRARSKEHYYKNKERYLIQFQEYRQNNREYLLAQGREYQQKNRDRLRPKWLAYYKDNAETIKARSKEWYEQNKERAADRGKQWRENNRERSRVREKQWRQENRDKLVANVQRYRARKRGSEGNHTAEEWRALREHYGNKCLYPGCSETRLTADHIIPLSRGGSNYIANIQPLCPLHNSQKGTKIIDYRSHHDNHDG